MPMTKAEIAAVDQKLDELVRQLAPGETLTCEEIARRIGVRRGMIQETQRKALDKLRANPVLREYAEL